MPARQPTVTLVCSSIDLRPVNPEARAAFLAQIAIAHLSGAATSLSSPVGTFGSFPAFVLRTCIPHLQHLERRNGYDQAIGYGLASTSHSTHSDVGPRWEVLGEQRNVWLSTSRGLGMRCVSSSTKIRSSSR